MNPNALKQWMDFYMQNMKGSPRYNVGTSGFNPSPSDIGGDALGFAERMSQQGDSGAGQPMPDYFAKLPQQPDTKPGYNRLAALMGRRF